MLAVEVLPLGVGQYLEPLLDVRIMPREVACIFLLLGGLNIGSRFLTNIRK